MKTTFIFIFLFHVFTICGQTNLGFGQEEKLNHVLEGKIYPFYMPKNYTFSSKGYYGIGYHNQPAFSKIYTRYLNVKEQTTNTYMDGIPLDYAAENKIFCILYEGNICISETSDYIFQLKSDDGSTLWIDDKVIINNDQYSQMSRVHRDTIHLEQGSHSVKVWYFQGAEPMMGLELKMKKVDDKDYYLADFYCIPYTVEKKIVMGNSILFETGKAVLKKEAQSEIKKLSEKINLEKYKTVIIDGYTDNTGSEEINKKLSLERADAIQIALKANKVEANIKINGFGSNNPIGDNNTESGRSKNRRVEIRLVK